MSARSHKAAGRRPSGRQRINVMVDRKKLKQAVAAVGAPSSSAAIDEALDRLLEQTRLARALDRWGGRFPDFAIPGE
jgi:hypothetical protein